jgi:TolB-like protein
VLAAGTAAVVAGAGFIAWRTLFAPDGAPANSIAVLPFQNLSGDPSQQYLSDGLAAELRAKLARNAAKRRWAASSNAFRERGDNAPTIARKLSRQCARRQCPVRQAVNCGSQSN